jgi:hypothetical protein
VDSCEIYGNKTGLVTVSGNGAITTNNIIYGNDVGVHLKAFFNSPNIIFKNNKICKNSTNIFYTYPNNADLSDNCWCSTDSIAIMKTIYDGYDNAASGIISIGNPDSCTVPDLPVNVSLVSTANNSIHIYPHPLSEQATLELNLPAGNYTATITDLSGKVHRTVNNVTAGRMVLYRDDLASGLYLLRISQGSETKALTKLVVQ